jgi:hypothetical protein
MITCLQYKTLYLYIPIFKDSMPKLKRIYSDLGLIDWRMSSHWSASDFLFNEINASVKRI